ncbi:hypothetical protein B9Z55_026447 [Caenorhabditis nigoni]|uniref:Protein kinase domain-containing protein n=1 Tax=Caenorhabditis nigoni TaxID=1611254 RepID=A0A2G5T2U7_9PELO|nr:hypothetical protein B9Z55_026447 [Caenorhabditis nigoni]
MQTMSSFFGWLFCRQDSSMEVLRKDRQFEPVRILKTGPHYKEILCNNANGNLEFAIAKVFHGNTGMREYAKEFELLTDLKHTNIIEILAKNTLAGFRILVFRNLMNISGRIEMRIPFPVGSVQSLFKDLLTGLSFLHENKYAHRQICPENLLYTPDGVLKITGLSNIALIRNNIKEIQLKGLIGDIMYSPPECFKPAPYSGIDADIYSAGLTLYAMLKLYKP